MFQLLGHEGAPPYPVVFFLYHSDYSANTVHYFIYLFFLFMSVLPQCDFSNGKFCRIALPNLWCMLSVLVFPWCSELWHELPYLKCVHRCKCMGLHKGVCRRHTRVCTESWLMEKNPLPHRGIEPASVACESDALWTELHLHHVLLWLQLVLGVRPSLVEK